YVRAVLDTIEFPPTDHQLRQQLTLEAKQLGTGHLVKELQRVDPDAAQRLKDDRRIIRAVEVYRLTGKPFSSYMPTRMYHQSIPPVIQVGLITERSQLHKRIEQRVYTMMATGWVDEVKRLMVQGLAEAPTASRAIGYRQIMEYIQGKISKEAAIESTIMATRKFARRQETWFKADPRVHWIDTATTNLVAEPLQSIEDSKGSGMTANRQLIDTDDKHWQALKGVQFIKLTGPFGAWIVFFEPSYNLESESYVTSL